MIGYKQTSLIVSLEMQQSYNMDSDSDESDDESTGNTMSSNGTNSLGSIVDIETLKEKSNELLDTSWKANKNKGLLTKMLELEEPSITPKMVDFLLQDGVCELLMDFVTLRGEESRPTHEDMGRDSLKLSYRATMLLSADEPSDTLLVFVGKRVSLMARLLFGAFEDDSAASFYHIFRIFEFLLRNYPSEVFDGIIGDGNLASRMSLMLGYIGYPPVNDMLVMLICLTPVPRNSQVYISCAKYRWNFFEELGKYLLLYKMTEVVVNPGASCKCDENISADDHSLAACQALHELVEKLSVEDTGEFLLQPFGYIAPGHTQSIVDLLHDCACEKSGNQNEIVRKNASKLLCFLLKRSVDPELMCVVGPANGLSSIPTYVPNRLHPLRQLLLNMLMVKFRKCVDALLSFDSKSGNEGDGTTSMKHSGYVVEKPFTILRSHLVELLILLVEADANIAESITSELWTEMIKWVVEYAHNNIYHNLFYRLLFAVLRSNNEATHRMIFVSAKFINALLDNFVPYEDVVLHMNDDTTEQESEPDKKSMGYISKLATRGIIMDCCNAVRLQASSQPPSGFLRSYLKSVERWNTFIPMLRMSTEFQQNHGMGIKVTDARSNIPQHIGSLSLFSEPLPDSEIDHGSRLAKSLGFVDEVAWPGIKSVFNMLPR